MTENAMFRDGEFTYMVVISKAMLEAVHRLRYKVYVEEYEFLKAKDNPGRLERDEYDPYSVQIAALNGQGQLAGSIRLILSSDKGFPTWKLTPHRTLSHKDAEPDSEY